MKSFLKTTLIFTLVAVLMLSLTACKTNDVVDNEDVKETNETITTDETNPPEKEIEEGLVHEGEMELKYAKHFAVDYYKGGYKVITDASDRKLLVVPEGKEVPKLDEEMVILKQPLESFGTYSTIDPSWFKPLNELQKIKTVSFEAEKWKTDDMHDLVESGEIVYVGKSSALDYELIQEINPDLHLMSKSSGEKLFEKFDELDMNYLSMGSYIESDPRGRLEWTKLIGALLNKEAEAESYFESELKRVDAVEEKIEQNTEDRPKVTMAYFSGANQEFKVTNVEGYKVKHIEMAGGSYYPPDLGVDKRGSTTVTPEEFYKIIDETDILIYDSVSGHSIKNLDDFIEYADYLKDTDVYKNQRIWGLKRDFWQAGEKVADMTEEYYEIFYLPNGDIEETNFFYKMK